MQQDQNNKFWEGDKLVGYIDQNLLCGINPKTGYAELITDDFGHYPTEKLEKWLRLLRK